MSGWDVDSDVLLPHLIVEQTIPSIRQNINKYYLVENGNERNIISKYFRDQFRIFVSPEQVMVSGSATSLLCLVLLSLISGTNNPALVLEPSYFSVHDTLNLLQCNFQTICVSDTQFSYDYRQIEHIVQERSIRVIVVTDPIFGSGIPINSDGYQQLIALANQYHCTLVVDMARMGLLWDSTNEPILGERFSLICKAEQYAVVYSPCKKVFANGAKTGVLLSSKKVMERLQIYGDSVLGAVSASQASFLAALLSDQSRSYISKQMATNISLAKSRYDILHTLLQRSNCRLIRPQMGHYALAYCPTKKNSEWEIFLKLLYEAGVYTLPMGLYGFHSRSSYVFRVNLLSELEGLVHGMECIITILKDSE